jgi:hypothetical protein
LTFRERLPRVVVFQLWGHLIVWRWLLVVPAFLLAAVIAEDLHSSHARNIGFPGRCDAWDLFPTVLRHDMLLHFLVGLGFLLLVGDSYLRERGDGGAALSVMRLRDRSLYWLGKMGALGILALLFALTGLVIVAAAGMVLAPPSSAFPMLPRTTIVPLYPNWAFPLPVFNLLVAVSTAWSLWVLGCATVLLSVFVKNRVITLLAAAGWAMVSSDHSGFQGSGLGRLLYMGYFIGPHKHMDDDPIPVWVFFLITLVLLAAIAFAGTWKLRREEL